MTDGSQNQWNFLAQWCLKVVDLEQKLESEHEVVCVGILNNAVCLAWTEFTKPTKIGSKKI